MLKTISFSKWKIGLLIAVFFAVAVNAQIPNPENPSENPQAEVVQEVKGSIVVKPQDETILKDLEKKVEVEKPTPIQAVNLEKNLDSQKFGLHSALGIPHPLSFGLDYVHSSKLFSASINLGSYTITQEGVNVSLVNSEVGIRYHPFASAFFLGALLGQQNLRAKKTETNSGVLATVEVTVKSTYVTPYLGWHWLWDCGFSMGMELGWQSPLSSSVDFTSNASELGVANTADYIKQEKDARDIGDQIGKMGLPYITLLRLGWLF